MLFNLPVDTIGTQYGELPRFLPTPSLPSLHIPEGKLQEYLFDAMAVAFLGALESLLSAVIADGMIGSRHKSNCELIGQGVANLASVIFGGIPATGALARTAANVKTGAQTPVAGMIHAALLLGILFFLAPLVSKVPLCALAAVLVVVSWNMSEAHYFLHLFRAPPSDVAVLLTVFFLTVFVDITFAIAFGMILASLLFMKRMGGYSKTVAIDSLFLENIEERSDPDKMGRKQIPSGVEVYEVQGPLFFGAADLLQTLLAKKPEIFILRMRNVPFIDASGMHALREFFLHCQRIGAKLILSSVQPQTAKDLKQFGLYQQIGSDAICSSISDALTRAKKFVK